MSQVERVVTAHDVAAFMRHYASDPKTRID